MDGIENILGIAAGSSIYWLALRLMRPCPKLNPAAGSVECAAEENAADD
jgi:hypothetical protein